MSSKSSSHTAYLDQPKPGRLNIQYAPDETTQIVENPPRFTWLPVVENEARYVLRISTDKTFSDKATQTYSNIPLNFFTPDTTFKKGVYYWSYSIWNETDKASISQWSQIRKFTIVDNLPSTPLIGRTARYDKCATSHPRLWLSPELITQFKSELKSNPDHCSWAAFFEKSVKPWLERPVMDEPAPYPNNVRVAPIWRQTYIDCQELIYAIRHLAIAGHILEDDDMLAKAKAWLLSAAEWDPDGPTSRAYTDEWAFRVAVAIAWGYDWLHGQLTEDERTLVRKSLMARTKQVADHVIKHANIHLFPYDSHAVRSVSAVLIPACITMWDEEEQAREWLDYSIELMLTV
jgi:hypothetical protein